jgi:hypothetical protein
MIYSAAHNVCVYDTPIPERILACVPMARQVDACHVAVPCKIDEMRRMVQLGYEAMSPILVDYDWPRDRSIAPEPFPQQRAMAAFTTLYPRAFNLSDLRTGKTLATLWACDYLMRLGYIHKVLILSTLSTIVRVWENDIFRHFLGQRTAMVLYGSREQRLQRLEQPADFYILNHDGLTIGSKWVRKGKANELVLGPLAEAIIAREDIDAVVTDEGTVYKDAGTTRYKVAKRVIAKKASYTHLTGTPTPNSPTDAYAQRKLLTSDWVMSETAFRDATMVKVSTFKWVPKATASQTAADTLQPAIRFDRFSCLGTLPITPEVRDVELSPAQKKAYAEMKKYLQSVTASGEKITALNEAGLRQKLVQIACGAVYGPNHEVHMVDAAPRLSVLHELIVEAPHKILIFAPLTSVVQLLYRELSKHYSVEMVTGGVSSGKRNAIFKAFQEDVNPRIIVADPRTMSHGLTMTAADTIVWYAPIDVPEPFTQANGRIEGSSQKDDLAIYCLAATPVEREAFRRLANKESLQGLILALVKGE